MLARDCLNGYWVAEKLNGSLNYEAGEFPHGSCADAIVLGRWHGRRCCRRLNEFKIIRRRLGACCSHFD